MKSQGFHARICISSFFWKMGCSFHHSRPVFLPDNTLAGARWPLLAADLGGWFSTGPREPVRFPTPRAGGGQEGGGGEGKVLSQQVRFPASGIDASRGQHAHAHE